MLRHMINEVRSHHGRAKRYIDRVIDPAMFWLASNGAYLAAADKTLDYISKKVDSHEGLAMVSAYAVLGTGLWYLNKHTLIPATKKIGNYYRERIRDGSKARGLSWFRSASQLGAIAGLCMLLDFGEILNTFRYDGQRVVNSFARKEIAMPKRAKENVEDVLPDYPVKKNGGPMAAGALEGRILSDLYSRYTGIEGRVPGNIDVDFGAQLESMWAEKKRASNNPVVDQVINSQVKGYAGKRPTTMTIDSYIKIIDRVIGETKQNINWKKVRSSKGLSSYELELLKDISSSINGRDLLAYGLTEIMPSKDGKLNKAMLDFLLRNAGREYVELIPAMHDAKTSFGPYQFTEYALYDARGTTRGASTINQALPERLRIPGSVIYLKGDDHHRAAYLFAIGNLAELIKGLDRRELPMLGEIWAGHKDDMIKFIATSHHLPGEGINAAKRWIDHGARYDYTVSCSRLIRGYSEKTSANLTAMHSRF